MAQKPPPPPAPHRDAPLQPGQKPMARKPSARIYEAVRDNAIEAIASFIETYPKEEWDKFKGRADVANLIRRYLARGEVV
jgi:hypothetical protein